MSISQIICNVTDKGITAPTYDVILNWFQEQYRSIYGQDIVLDNSTQDGQWIAIQAQAVNASNQAMIAVFNSFSPAKAQGTALSSNVKINGIKRKDGSNSSCDVIITGVPGTIIQNGLIQDTINNYTWKLPVTVIIPSSGEITVTSICQVPGAVTVNISTLTIIKTPTNGWQTVTNATTASVGKEPQSDADLRIQQAASTMIPAYSIMDALIGAILNLKGVIDVKGYENNLGNKDEKGIPANSIALVVDGGDATEIATIIANKKSMGVGTYGETSVTVINPIGGQQTINFLRPIEIGIFVSIRLQALTDYTNEIGQSIAQNVSSYILSQKIGCVIYTTRLFAQSTLPNDNGGLTYDIIDIQIGLDRNNLSSSNLKLEFNQKPMCPVANITINATE